MFLFAVLHPRRAVIAAFIGGWLFLPMAGYKIQGLPDFTKISATHLGVLLAATVFDTNGLLSFRPRWFDVPMLVFCLTPIGSSLSNQLPVYDGLSGIVAAFIMWGIPYLIGRIYFTDAQSLRELAIGIVVGGLIYVPLCLIEMRFSPQLHKWLYGFHQHQFAQTRRYGGFRPMVFLYHPLAVAFWIASAAVVCECMRATRSVRRIVGMPVGLCVIALIVITVLCRSAGPLILLILGLGLFHAMLRFRVAWPVLVVIAAVPFFLSLRITGAVNSALIISSVRNVLDAQRVGSLQVRVENEDRLIEKAMQRPFFGWGGYGRNRVYDERGRDITITDGLWIITLGQRGIVGLGSLVLILLLPAFWLFWKRRAVLQTMDAAAVGLGIISLIHMLDCIPNAMFNPVLVVAVGAVSSAATISTQPREKTRSLTARCLVVSPPRI